MPSTTGKLIVIEGLEGAGKSTAVRKIIEQLALANIQSITTREPGGTPVGEMLRTIIKDPEYSDVLDDRSELLLLYTARMQLIEQVIKPSLAQGIWVIADRFELSTMAYQGGGRGLDLTMIHQLSAFCLNGFKPDLTLYLDISPELGMQRAKSRGAFDRIEQQGIDFFHRVHETYIHCVKSEPNVCVVDASQDLPAVEARIAQIMTEFIGQ